MAKVWMRSKTGVSVKDEHGTRQSYRPGDWFKCGKHLARKLIIDGAAEFANIRDQDLTLQLSDCGIVLYGGDDKGIERAGAYYKLEIIKSEPELRFSRTMIVRAGSPIKVQMIPTGYNRLEMGWQVAIPTYGEDRLAEEIGTVEERERTREIVRDLRVPVYDTRAIFIARCADTKALIEMWNEERRGGDDMLAFLRAHYVVKPQMLQLPSTMWMG